MRAHLRPTGQVGSTARLVIVPAPALVERETPLLPQLDWMRPGVVTEKVSALAAAAVHDLGSRLFGPSVACGPGRRRTIALTFDDGPSPGSLEIAEYLAEQGVRATFFQCGENVVRHPRIARAIAWAGHEIGNHTFSHRRLRPRLGWQLNLLSKDQVYEEFARAQTVIMSETGAVPTLLRAPYGLRWRGMREAQRRLELLGVMWTVIGRGLGAGCAGYGRAGALGGVTGRHRVPARWGGIRARIRTRRRPWAR